MADAVDRQRGDCHGMATDHPILRYHLSSLRPHLRTHGEAESRSADSHCCDHATGSIGADAFGSYSGRFCDRIGGLSCQLHPNEMAGLAGIPGFIRLRGHPFIPDLLNRSHRTQFPHD